MDRASFAPGVLTGLRADRRAPGPHRGPRALPRPRLMRVLLQSRGTAGHRCAHLHVHACGSRAPCQQQRRPVPDWFRHEQPPCVAGHHCQTKENAMRNTSGLAAAAALATAVARDRRRRTRHEPAADSRRTTASPSPSRRSTEHPGAARAHRRPGVHRHRHGPSTATAPPTCGWTAPTRACRWSAATSWSTRRPAAPGRASARPSRHRSTLHGAGRRSARAPRRKALAPATANRRHQRAPGDHRQPAARRRRHRRHPAARVGGASSGGTPARRHAQPARDVRRRRHRQGDPRASSRSRPPTARASRSTAAPCRSR